MNDKNDDAFQSNSDSELSPIFPTGGINNAEEVHKAAQNNLNADMAEKEAEASFAAAKRNREPMVNTIYPTHGMERRKDLSPAESNASYVDHGDQLQANDSSQSTAEKLIQVAQVKGWRDITVEGRADFKRAAWIEAVSSGMEVSGYSPTEEDKKEAHFRSLSKDFIKDPIAASERHPELRSATAVLVEMNREASLRDFNHDEINHIKSNSREMIGKSIENGRIPEPVKESVKDAAEQQDRDIDR